MVTAITDVQIFDGDRVLDERTVVLDGALISAIGGPVPPGAVIVDSAGATLLPGLIDSHTHTSMDSLSEPQIGDFDVFLGGHGGHPSGRSPKRVPHRGRRRPIERSRIRGKPPRRPAAGLGVPVLLYRGRRREVCRGQRRRRF